MYGWPVDDAARLAVSTVLTTRTSVQEAEFVLFSRDVYSAFEQALSAFGADSGSGDVSGDVFGDASGEDSAG